MKRLALFGSETHLSCSEAPFYYTSRGGEKQCGWEDFLYYLLFIASIVGCVSMFLTYKVTRIVKVLNLIVGIFVTLLGVFAYIKAYRAHAFCQQHILPLMQMEKFRIYCIDDKFYTTTGLYFFAGLLIIFLSITYMIKDENGIEVGLLDFSTSFKEKSTDAYARDSNESDQDFEEKKKEKKD
ncbi:Uncharacterized protein QTN25_008579 [Entamoeba marina]